MMKAKEVRYTFIDLFSGAGGFSSGFKKADFELLGALENVEIFCKTHQNNFPESKTAQADICALLPSEFENLTDIRQNKIDVIIGSPPCQTFSTIGIPKIKSLNKADIHADPRNHLFKYFFDYVKYYRPKFFVMENVATLKTRFHGKLFQRILELVDEIGYQPHVAELNAVEYGVPQIRKRLFVVGTCGGLNFSFPKITHCQEEGEEQPKLLLHSTKNPSLKKLKTVYDAIADLPEIYDGCREAELSYSKYYELSEYQIVMRNNHGKVGNNTCRVSNERAKRIFPFMAQGSKYMDLAADIRKILPFREDIFQDRLKRLDMTKPSWTILAHIGMDGYMYIHPTENRTLSVREAARIQGFHDSFEFLGNMREQYVQVGNAVPPLLAKAIADSIKKSLG